MRIESENSFIKIHKHPTSTVVLLLAPPASHSRLPRRHPLPEAVDTTALEFFLLLTRVDRVTHPANFHLLLLDGARDQKYRFARETRGLPVFEHRWVDCGLHSGKIVQKYGSIARK